MGWSAGGASARELQLGEGMPRSPELQQAFRLAVQTQHSCNTSLLMPFCVVIFDVSSQLG